MSSQADDIAAALTKQVETAVKALSLEIAANLIETTPVDTGWARANWVPSIGAPVEEVAGEAPNKGETPSTSEQQAGQAKVLQFKLADGAAFVSNNVPYINLLDLGNSKQAPAGFVEMAIDVAVQTIQGRYNSLQLDVSTAGRVADIGALAAGNVASAYSPFGGDE